MRVRGAFTLIETVFVMAVVSIILVVMIQMFFGVSKNVMSARTSG